jgi:hypothetical protein
VSLLRCARNWDATSRTSEPEWCSGDRIETGHHGSFFDRCSYQFRVRFSPNNNQAIAGEHRPSATRFSVDAEVSTLSFRSWAPWLLGYPEATLADADDALKDALEIGQASALMAALNVKRLPSPFAEITRQQTCKPTNSSL